MLRFKKFSGRVVDLLPVFQGILFFPEMKNSASIKSVYQRLRQILPIEIW